MDKKCLGNLNGIFHSFSWRYFTKNPRATMMSPRDKIHIIELSVIREGLFVQLYVFFNVILCLRIKMKNKSNQINWILSVSPWFIKNGPRETIHCICWFWNLKQIFQITNHYIHDKQGHSSGSQWKHKLWKQPKWIKTYFCTMSPRDKYDECDVSKQAPKSVQIPPKSMQILQTNDIANYSWYS